MTNTARRTRQIAEQVASLIRSSWHGMTASDGVTRVYSKEIGFNEQDTPTLLNGRQVFVYAVERRLQGLQDRGEADNRHKVVIHCFERYTGTANEVPTDWMDTRADFVEDNLFLPFVDFRSSALGDTLFPDLDEFGTIDFIYDTTYLTQHKVFFSQVSLYIQEVA